MRTFSSIFWRIPFAILMVHGTFQFDSLVIHSFGAAGDNFYAKPQGAGLSW